MNKRVLIITDEFPPDRSGRAEKIGRRAKYLARFGWQVSVLVPQSKASNTEPLPPVLQGIDVHRTSYFFKNRWPSLKHQKNRPINLNQSNFFARLLDLIFVPKGYIRWIPFALAKGIQLANKSDVILTLNNPITLHIIGWILRWITHTPWIVELRDPIVGYTYSRRGPELFNKLLENLIIRSAKRVVQWPEATPEPIVHRYPSSMKDKFCWMDTLGYGYDPDQFQGDAETSTNKRLPLKIVYTGSFYGDSIVPDYILRALAQSIHRQHINSSDIHLQFAGDWSNQYDKMISELDITKNVSYLGFLSHAECVSLWQNSDVLLLMLGGEQDNIDRIPSKFWDYVGAKKLILALAPPNGRIAQILVEQNMGICIAPTDINAISHALKELVDRFNEDKLIIAPNVDFVKSASCIESEQKISDILESAVALGS